MIYSDNNKWVKIFKNGPSKICEKFEVIQSA